MELKYWAATDVGRQRDHNEDNFLIDKKLRLFVVADGMGGHAAGEVASSVAVHEVRDVLHENRDLVERFDAGDPSVQSVDVLQILEHAVQQACGAIYKRAQVEQEKRGMGTTCSLLLIAGPTAGGRGFIAHVGDSRIYLVRQGQTHQLTEDHSLMNELIRRGKVKAEDIDNSPYKQYKNAVTRAVGVYESVEVETFDLDVLPGDSFLLCSDGLYAYLTPNGAELPEILGNENINEIPKALIEKANREGGQDNITAICIRVPEADESTDLRAEELALKLEVLKGMPLFRYLTYTELVRVMNIAEVKWYEAGDTLITEGQPGEEMFVILSGKVRLNKNGTDITALGKGAHFGEMALVDRGPRSASALAEETSRLLLIRRQDFYEIIKKEPSLSVKLLWSFVQVLAERLRKTTADLSGARLAERAEDLSDDVFVDEPDA
jgi:serine/threonine protein phosphatase PrpC